MNKPSFEASSVAVKDLSVSFGGRGVLYDVSLQCPVKGVTVLVGRSGSGKTTLLRAMNRLNEAFPACCTTGQVEIDMGSGLMGIYPELGYNAPPAWLLRRRVGMVFQSPNVLPCSVFDNIAIPLKVVAECPRSEVADRVQTALRSVHLWEEVEQRLHAGADRLSGGQQQRLCLARALALQPAVLLLDEPTSSLDIRSAVHIEELLLELAGQYPLVIVSHHPGQAARLADRLFVMEDGRIHHELSKYDICEEAIVSLLQ